MVIRDKHKNKIAEEGFFFIFFKQENEIEKYGVDTWHITKMTFITYGPLHEMWAPPITFSCQLIIGDVTQHVSTPEYMDIWIAAML